MRAYALAIGLVLRARWLPQQLDTMSRRQEGPCRMNVSRAIMSEEVIEHTNRNTRASSSK